MKVTCKICKSKIEKNEAFCITKINENTNKKTNFYYCSEEEYNEDKETKALWQKLLIEIDVILGYTCISKTKVNMIKEIEDTYSRKQLYECVVTNSEEIKRYLDDKDIYEEYGRLAYIFSCIKNKINDQSKVTKITLESSYKSIDCLEETDEDILNRVNNNKTKKEQSLMDIIKSINKDKK